MRFAALVSRAIVSAILGIVPARIPIDRERIADFCRRNHIRRLAIFGSAVRDDFAPGRSDVDVLVEFEEGRTPGFAFFAMAEELSTLLGSKVDLHTLGSLGQRMRKRVAADAEVQYEQTDGH